MTREQAISYLRNSGFSEEQINEIVKALEPTTKNDLGVDAVNREAVLDLIADYDLSMGQVVKGIHALPSVTPQEPRKGHWIEHPDNCGFWEECSVCGTERAYPTDYCPDCGAKMVEPQERGQMRKEIENGSTLYITP